MKVTVLFVLAMCLSRQGVSEEFEDHAHLGVASCASSVCHGKLTKQAGENVWLNEFRMWSTEDRHARAYKTLSSNKSKLIAQKLGLKSAQSADICLDCHTDNVSTSLRDPKFQITDGVSCEACHGGAELWLESHTEPGVTHANNLMRGMYPTENPARRAELCLSCHMGTPEKFTTHEIMGAGHPRLTFELEAFTVNQPAHYAVDADYIERKRSTIGFGLWLTGQVEAADAYLKLLQSDRLDAPGMFPEFSLYDCHSCHHPMDDQRWTLARKNQGLKAGALRLQDQHLIMLRAVTEVLDSNNMAELQRLTNALVRAGQTSNRAVRESAAMLSNWLRATENTWVAVDVSVDNIRAIRKAIVTIGADGLLSDYAAAEQAFLGVESLSLYIGDADRISTTLDDLYTAVESDETFSPKDFRAAARKALDRF